MDTKNFDEYVETRYNGQLAYYSKTSAKYQKKYKQFQWTLIILSAITPVLAALSGKSIRFNGIIFGLDLQIVVIIVSAIVAILTTGLKTFNYHELWINCRSTYEKLKPEIYYYNFGIGPYDTEGIDKESLFVSRVEAMVDTEHTQWAASKQLQGNLVKIKTEEPLPPDSTKKST
ncbi:MAG: DUF4231 domain-containing protein [Ginsengibacter sp.]